MSKDVNTQEELVITVNTVEGKTIDCTVLTTFELEKREYIALIAHDDSNQIQLFRYKTVDQEGLEGIEIISIQSDMEFEAALNAFESLLID